jgi:hypothetical protein
MLAVLAFNSEQVLFGVRVCDRGILAGSYSHHSAASRITQHIAGQVLFRPCTVCAGQFLTGLQHTDGLLVRLDLAALL